MPDVVQVLLTDADGLVPGGESHVHARLLLHDFLEPVIESLCQSLLLELLKVVLNLIGIVLCELALLVKRGLIVRSHLLELLDGPHALADGAGIVLHHLMELIDAHGLLRIVVRCLLLRVRTVQQGLLPPTYRLRILVQCLRVLVEPPRKLDKQPDDR